MPQLTPISKQRHADKSWTLFTTHTFVAKDNLTPLVAAEISKAISSLPIVYAQLLSMDNIQVFAQLAKTRAQMNQMAQAKSASQVTDIQPILGDDDMISF